MARGRAMLQVLYRLISFRRSGGLRSQCLRSPRRLRPGQALWRAITECWDRGTVLWSTEMGAVITSLVSLLRAPVSMMASRS